MTGRDAMPVQRAVSAIDVEHLAAIRQNIRRFMAHCAHTYAGEGGLLLDVAPQAHEGAQPYFGGITRIETLDIDPSAGGTYTADICRHNPGIPDGRFRYIVCTEVLEHVRQPFAAVAELTRLLAPGGYLFVSTPFDFRIHGPLPDCWRFTEHGLRELFREFEIVELEGLEVRDRFLMPVQYTLIARKPA